MLTSLRNLVFAAGLAFASTAANAQPIPDLAIPELEEQIRAGELGKIRAVAVMQDGETVYRERFGEGAMGDPVDIKSAGKSITALAVAAAIADGHLSGTDIEVWPYLGMSRGAPWNAITVRDLLNMSSALDCNDWERRSPGQEERMYRRRDWTEFALNLPAREFERDERGFGSFSYCTAGVFLLGQVVGSAVGERFDLYVQRRLFDPLGIDGVEWRSSRKGEVQSGGQLTISDEALLKIGQMLMNGGEWEGEQILPKEMLRGMFIPVHQLGPNVHYGNLFWFSAIRSQRGFEGALMMKGNGGNIVAIVPTMNAVLVVQSESYNRPEAERNSFIALTTVLRSLPVPEPDTPIEATAGS